MGVLGPFGSRGGALTHNGGRGENSPASTKVKPQNKTRETAKKWDNCKGLKMGRSVNSQLAALGKQPNLSKKKTRADSTKRRSLFRRFWKRSAHNKRAQKFREKNKKQREPDTSVK